MSTFSRRINGPFVIGLTSGSFAMALYALTVAPTISWGDSADLAMRLVSDVDQSFVGTHRDYVLWRQVGQVAALFPIHDAGLRANLFTAFWGAVTVGAVAAFVQVVSRSAIAAFAAACSLAVAHSFWLLSVIAEVYTFNTAMVCLSFLFIACWWYSGRQYLLMCALLFCGVSLSHHATGLVLLASLAPLIAARARNVDLWAAVIGIVIFLSASSIYWIDALPRLWSGVGVLDAMRLRMPQNEFFDISVPKEMMKFVAYLSFNFIGAGILLGFAGIYYAIIKRIMVVAAPFVWAGALVYAGLTSSIPDKFNVYVLVYPSFAIFVGLGVAWGVGRFAWKKGAAVSIVTLLLLVPPLGYAASVYFSRTLDVDLVGARIAPLRDNAEYFLWPPKYGDYGPKRFAERALSDMPAAAILIADYTLWRPILYVQTVESYRADVEVKFVERLLAEGVDNWIAQQPCGRRVFLATITPTQYYQADRIEKRFNISEHGSVFEVKRACQ